MVNLIEMGIFKIISLKPIHLPETYSVTSCSGKEIADAHRKKFELMWGIAKK
jgi:hypothetical protein